MKNAIIFIMLLSLGLACADKKTEAPASEVKPEVPAQAAESEKASDATKAATEALKATEAKPEVPADAAKALGEALKAASAAGTAGGSDCENAYDGMKAMFDALSKAAPDAKAQSPGMPEKDKFLGVCEKLPTEVQKCMTMQYAMANQEACKKAMESVSPELKAEMESLKGGK